MSVRRSDCLRRSSRTSNVSSSVVMRLRLVPLRRFVLRAGLASPFSSPGLSVGSSPSARSKIAFLSAASCSLAVVRSSVPGTSCLISAGARFTPLRGSIVTSSLRLRGGGDHPISFGQARCRRSHRADPQSAARADDLTFRSSDGKTDPRCSADPSVRSCLISPSNRSLLLPGADFRVTAIAIRLRRHAKYRLSAMSRGEGEVSDARVGKQSEYSHFCAPTIGAGIQMDCTWEKRAEHRRASPAVCHGSLAQRSGQLPQFVQQLDRGCG